ncbi:MAG: amidase [Alphaproteobacteria bacterium]|nr:amidase [Alphaproteobacteria bacterium]
MSNPCGLTAREARRLIGAKRLSPVELLESCITQIGRVNPAVNAVVTECFSRARAEAKRAEQAVVAGETLGPLHGLPIAIKDNQDTESVRTAHGSPHFRDNVPKADSGIVAAIREAGGIVVGKTNIPEMSIGANTVNRLFGATGNPFDPQRTCGGSSGGSAVALACEMVPLATGSDHGGSLRIPASFCGVVGHRSSAGVVPNEKRALAHSVYSVQGPMARTVGDAALLLSVIARRPTRDPMAFPLDPARFARLDEADLGRLKIAVSADLGGLLVSQEIRRTFRERIARFAGLFRECAWADIDLGDAPDVDWKLRSEFFVAQYHEDADGWDADFNPNIRNNYAAALKMPMREVAIAHRRQMALCQSFQSIFDQFDLLICPTVSVSPFPWADLYPQSVDGRAIGTYMEWLGLTAALTVVGHPVTALPCGLDAQGMPFGLQIVGPNFADHAVLSAAQALEAALAADPTLARPSPDLARLAAAPRLGKETGG